MQFLNDTKLDDLSQKKVSLILRSGSNVVNVVVCSAIVRDGNLFLDCIPKRPGKYIAKVPDDAVISRRNESAPEHLGDFCVIVDPESEPGKLISSLSAAKHKMN